MKLSSLRDLPSFALMGPGFSGAWTLLEPLEADRLDGPHVVLAAYEDRADEAWVFGGPERRLDELEVDVPAAELAPEISFEGHREGVETIRMGIAAGDVYQVNLTLRAALGEVPAGTLFARLLQRATPRFAAWVRLPDGTEVVSASPELFFRVDGKDVSTEPMKGTARPDAQGQLVSSEKDRAELAMITDLMRNDLAPVCEPGSVEVVEERRIIELPYALQTVSDVTGRLRSEVAPLDVLAALHPGGSITGTPKHAAMGLIDRLEDTARGPYCGALGRIDGDRAVFSILIRTAHRQGTGFVYGVGGGIVWESSPEAERDEIVLKMGALS